MNGHEPKLFDEFPPISTEAWMAAIAEDLKGADFEKRLVKKTEDGLSVRPFYRKEDLPASVGDAPGQFPYTRGASRGKPWAIRQGFRAPSPREANEQARYALMRGCEQLALVLYPAGTKVLSSEDFETLLDGVFLNAVPVVLNAGPLGPQALALYANLASKHNLRLHELEGGLDYDPIVNSIRGYSAAQPEEWRSQLEPVLAFASKRLPKFRVLGVQGQAFDDAGAGVAQQVAYTLALFSEYLAGTAIPAGELAKRTELRFGIGSNYFLEVAKLRAARLLTARLLEAFGVKGVMPTLHAVTSSANMAAYDPHVNMLRVTTEAMSAAVAGVDSISVQAYDVAFKAPDQFSERIARNVQVLLREESHLAKVADPLGGSYAVESLTAQVADQAWAMFQGIEAAGGFVAAWNAGTISEQIGKVVAAKKKAISGRRQNVVGVSFSPNAAEQALPRLSPIKPVGVVKALDESVEDLAAKLAKGGSLLASAPAPDRAKLEPFRPFEAFESLRLRVEKHVAEGGKQPVVGLVLQGDRTWRKARAEFATGFFSAGGYKVQEGTQGADIAVLCSSDGEYPTLVPEFAAGPGAIKVVAGYPEDHLEAIKSAGVNDFIHIRLDVAQTLADFHARLGVA